MDNNQFRQTKIMVVLLNTMEFFCVIILFMFFLSCLLSSCYRFMSKLLKKTLGISFSNSDTNIKKNLARQQEKQIKILLNGKVLQSLTTHGEMPNFPTGRSLYSSLQPLIIVSLLISVLRRIFTISLGMLYVIFLCPSCLQFIL